MKREAMVEGGKVSYWMGIAVLILGFLCVLAPLAAGLAVAVSVAVLVIFAGITRLIWAFKAPSFGKGAFSFLLGGFSVIFGLAMLARPLLGLASLTLIIVVYFLIQGICEISAAFRLKPARGWKFMLFGGVISIILGLMIWRQWPLSGVWAIGVLVGIHLMFTGISMITVGTAIKEMTEKQT